MTRSLVNCGDSCLLQTLDGFSICPLDLPDDDARFHESSPATCG